MEFTGYYDEQNNDIYNVYETSSSNNTNVHSGVTGIYISVQSTNSGPLTLQTNGTQNINIQSDLSGSILFKPNKITSLQIESTGIEMSPQGTTTFWNDSIGNMYCFNQWRYGVRVINNTSNATFTLSLTDPRNIFFIGTSSCSLVFPASPPNGTEYFIRKTSTTTYTISITTNATLRSNNTEQTTFAPTSKNSGVIYSTRVLKWICFNIGA